MQFLNFTPQEIRALLFLLTALLVGSGITLYKMTHPQFAPELIVERKDWSALGQKPSAEAVQKPPPNRKINLNQANAYDLEQIRGLGPKLSQRIVEYREVNGPFQKLEDLMKVPGVGPKTLEQIKDYVTVDY